MKTVKLNTLQKSQEILQHRNFSVIHANLLKQNLLAGDTLPPMIVTSDNIIVSGYHRFQAYKDAFGEDYEVEVIVKDFPDEAEMLKEFVKENRKHGLKLSNTAERTIISRLIELGIPETEVSDLFSVSEAVVYDRAGTQTQVINGKGQATPKPVKGNAKNLPKTPMTAQQYNTHMKKDRSIPLISLCEQLIRHIDNDWVDMSKPNVAKTITILTEKLTELVTEKV